MLKKSRYGKCIRISVRKGKPYFEENKEEIKKKRKAFW
jgi:hypothetical protein